MMLNWLTRLLPKRQQLIGRDFVTWARPGSCPDCGNRHLLAGPQGGLCTNIECADCGARFNTASVIPGRFLIERIGKEA